MYTVGIDLQTDSAVEEMPDTRDSLYSKEVLLSRLSLTDDPAFTSPLYCIAYTAVVSLVHSVLSPYSLFTLEITVQSL